MSTAEIGRKEPSFLHERLKHEKAEEIGWKLRFHRKAANFHGDGLADAATGIGQGPQQKQVFLVAR
jgi:hypothetical protein